LDNISFITVFVTVPDRQAALDIAREVVKCRLAACANIVPNLTSVYRWEGKICEEGEELLIIKTRAGLFEQLRAKIKDFILTPCRK